MKLPLADALAVLYVLWHDWLAGRNLLAALGVKETDLNRLDDPLGLGKPMLWVVPELAQRHDQVVAMGGEIA